MLHGAALLLGLWAAVALPEPPCRKTVPSNSSLPLGVVSVVDFGADPTGANDSTAALQRALDAARQENVSVFLPLGCYKVTDALNATEPRNGRWQPVVVFGEQPVPSDDGRRPTLVLPPKTPGYSDPKHSRPVISFWTNWCLKPGPKDVYLVDEWCHPGDFHGLPPYMFNQVFQGVDILLREGNPGAVGVNMLGAQGSTIQDVTVSAAPDALAGVSGGCGGGGSFVGVKVIGARYGVDMRKTAGFPTAVALTLTNQTCAAVLVGSAPGGSSHTDSTLTITGLRVQGSPRLAGVLAGLDLPKKPNDECWAPKMLGGWMEQPYLTTNDVQEEKVGKLAPHQQSLVDAVSLVDASFDVTGAPCVVTNGSIYMSDVYATGCTNVIVASGQRLAAVAGAAVQHIKLLAFGRQNLSGISGEPFSYAFPAYVDGERSGDLVLHLGNDTSVPVDLQSRHHWVEGAHDWQTTGAMNALQAGAKGDGIADDWAALQAAVDSHQTVVLPKGFYRLSKPLILRRPGVALVGVGNTRSFLMPMSQGFSTAESPVLDISGKSVTVKSLSIITWDHLDAYAVRWSGENGLWRQVFANREHEASFPPFTMPSFAHIPAHTSPTHFNRPLIVISGGGAFYDFNLDFGCCFGTVVPKDVEVGPDIASSGEILLQGPSHRILLVNGSTSGLRFYQHNLEQTFGDAHSEIRWSKNVTLYGAKSEGNYVALWIRDSDLVTVHGYGGNAAPFPNSTRYAKDRVQYMPSLFRVQRSTRVLLANILNDERITSPTEPSTLVAAGDGYDPRLYNMILHQDSDDLCDPIVSPGKCQATRVLDRPVLWWWSGREPHELFI
eukprot:TRINITY_DN2532_c0_g2_i1.p1 TRINITY_DN2532_c0_g2~~TRINITY_DN2532_c0_g2_i1.p1  ORF type:complete len:844 (+),score=112.04 TRINITY_DN2532_c0_g2_i1:34-2532(+)